MQAQNHHPLKYAEKIVEILANISIVNAKISLRIATELIDYRATGEGDAAWARLEEKRLANQVL
jgi:hypothetical protein